MKRQSNAKGPKFVQYFAPLIKALNQLGGSGKPSEVTDLISSWGLFKEDETEIQSDGGTRFSKNTHWARFYLAKVGLIDSSERGVWSLTESGSGIVLSQDQSMQIFKHVQSEQKKNMGQEASAESTDADTLNDPIPETLNHRQHLLAILQNLSPAGFENFCQFLLREAGFEDVKVTGRSGDGGIDGHGLLKVNYFVSFVVAFQCKRYTGSVGTGVIRDFRGSIIGRADKGIILTTGTFTGDAKREAIRDGATPIELVDGDKLLGMLEELKLGVKPVTSYRIEAEFFEKFK